MTAALRHSSAISVMAFGAADGALASASLHLIGLGQTLHEAGIPRPSASVKAFN